MKKRISALSLDYRDPGQSFSIVFLVLLLLGLCIISHKIIAPALSVLSIFLNSFRCKFEELLMLPCPGCGGTRSFVALFEGQIVESFRLNPMVPFFVISLLVLLLAKYLKWPLFRNPMSILLVALFLFLFTWVLRF